MLKRVLNLTSIKWIMLGMLTLTFAGNLNAEVKKSIAVAPVGWTAGTVSWVSGEQIQAMLITELNNSGNYRVVERENIQGILAEQDMGTAGRTRGKSSPKVGDIEGAQLNIKAVVTDAEEKSGEGGRVGFGGVSMGGGKTSYKITMDVRVYDMQTSLLLDSKTVSAEQVKKKQGGAVSFKGMSLGKNKSGGDTTGEIVRMLIQDAIVALEEMTKAVEWTSFVHSVKGERIIIIGGTRDGLEKGMTFKVYELGEQIVDEDTGEVLDEGEETEVGEIRVTDVKAKVAYAEKSGGKDPVKGNLIRLNME